MSPAEANLSRICVFCGSRSGVRPEFQQAAVELGERMAERGIGLVYGGASVGLMGAAADASLRRGGKVYGFIPAWLDKREIAHANLTELTVVDTMHERKRLMGEKSSAFIAMPGGFGTFDELFEVLTWAQIGIHQKPIGVLNTANYFDPFLRLVDHAVNEGFAQEVNRSLFVVRNEPSDLLSALESFSPPGESNKWERT